MKFPLELKLLLLLYAHLVLCIPFAVWRGGAFARVFGKFSKEVITAALVSLIVVNIFQLRKLLFVQARQWLRLRASNCLSPNGSRRPTTPGSQSSCGIAKQQLHCVV
jgi:hypothetical protein